MRLNDDYDNSNNSNPGGGFSTTTIAIGVFICVFAIFTIVLWVNREPARNAAIQSETQTVTDTVQEETALAERSTLTSEDLEFWSFFAEEKVSEEAKAEAAKKEETAKEGSTTDSKEESTQEVKKEHEKETLVIKANGEEEWLPLNPYLDKNKYDYAGLVYQEPIMKYFENSKQLSHTGISVFEELGMLDYNKLKKAGIEFVMLKVGARGYGSGKLSLDESFAKNMKGATESGLDVGVYFFSQAVSEEEAIEEANLLLEQVKEHKIIYPVAFDMEEISGDTARIDALSREVKSKVTGAFLKTVKDAGYQTAIYGNKEWLLQKINLSLLSEYDIWLSQEADIPDYPYKFAMWQYTSNAVIDGADKNVQLSISFIDYSLK